jgi:hypothetical protein
VARDTAGGVGGAREQRERVMTGATVFRDYQHCPTACELPGAEWPPTISPYPAASKPVRLLFVGVNPPPDGGFWADDNDTLLTKFQWIFTKLAWATGSGNADFRSAFLERGFYFIHTVKCYRQTKLPTRGKGALVRGCAKAHLKDEIAELEPERICLLGNDALEGIQETGWAFDGQRGDAAEGNERILSVDGRQIPVLVTYFPTGDLGRALLLCHLRRWHRAAQIPTTR